MTELCFYFPRSSYSYASAKDEGVSFLSTLQCMWRGFVNMAAVAKLVTKAFPVSGVLDHLTEVSLGRRRRQRI